MRSLTLFSGLKNSHFANTVAWPAGTRRLIRIIGVSPMHWAALSYVLFRGIDGPFPGSRGVVITAVSSVNSLFSYGLSQTWSSGQAQQSDGYVVRRHSLGPVTSSACPPPVGSDINCSSSAVSVSPMPDRNTASASGSSGVWSRLMITRRPPRCLVMRGKSAAGVTTSDEPIARIKSACSHHWLACRRTSAGSD